MSFQVRPLDPNSDDVVRQVLESAFARKDRESNMACALASHPSFDAELSLVAWEGDKALGAAIFLPQDLRIEGTRIASAACAPIGVSPGARGRGVGKALLAEGLTRLDDRGIRCVTAIGAAEFFSSSGFGAAFDLYTQRVPTALADEHSSSGAVWRGLRGEDLVRLPELHAASWSAIDGSLLRTSSDLDWEAQARDSHALCLEQNGELGAYLRFRVRETVEVTDCCVRDKSNVADVLALLARLGREHFRDVIELRLPPVHPVARAAFRLGSPIELSDFGGASLLAVLDWKGLLLDLASVLTPRLLRAPQPSLSLGIDGEDYLLAFRGGQLTCTPGRNTRQHVDIPPGWAPGLITGKNSGSEVAFETGVRDAELTALLEALFPRRCPTWAYGPVYEAADD